MFILHEESVPAWPVHEQAQLGSVPWIRLISRCKLPSVGFLPKPTGPCAGFSTQLGEVECEKDLEKWLRVKQATFPFVVRLYGKESCALGLLLL